MLDREPNPPAVTRERRLVLLAVGALGVSCVMTQLALMRELLGAFSGNELVLGVVLGNWLLLMGLGTWLGRTSDKLRNPLAVLAVMQILVAVLPLVQVFLLRALRNVIFVRGAAVGVTETVISAFILLMPYCLVAGYALTLACAIQSRTGVPPVHVSERETPDIERQSTGKRDACPALNENAVSAAGRVYVADSIGSIGGGALFSFVLVRFLDHAGILIYPAVLNLLIAGAMGFRAGHKLLSAIAGVLAVAVVAMAVLVDLDGVTTAWQYPRQHIVARANSPYGKLLVTESDGQFDFIENGIPLTSTRDDQHVEEAVHYAMAQRPDARKVLLVGGGISGTAKEILKYHVSRVDYVELDPLILEFGRKYLPENLADSRIRIINTDGRLFVRQTGEKYDVVIIDMPAPSTAQLNRFFTTEFLAEVKRVLAPGGVVSFALGHYENYVSPELARMLASASQSLKQSFPNVLVIPGGRVFFLASDGPLFNDIASRIERQGIKTKLMNRHYLDAILTADRMTDMQRAIAQPAALNTDFSPVLYFYHLRYWMSQFKIGFGVLQALLLVLLGVYLVRLRGAALVLFASGFAGTALEIVLLLAFQVLCGSVYHQVGVIVTVFMAGLALGAMMANRGTNEPFGGASSASPMNSGPRVTRPSDAAAARSESAPYQRQERYLRYLAFAIAGYAVLLAFLLPLLNRMGDMTASLWFIKTAIALLTLVLAVLVGMQFPLANRLEFDGTVVGASWLYTADFIGAFLGALLASTLLIPLIGVAGVCLLTAALNFLGGTMIQFRKAIT
ncbi:MAG: fused MFS/spermidine synthase [Verrucomicrobiota bacterium]|jgi:spermidine synthase